MLPRRFQGLLEELPEAVEVEEVEDVVLESITLMAAKEHTKTGGEDHSIPEEEEDKTSPQEELKVLLPLIQLMQKVRRMVISTRYVTVEEEEEAVEASAEHEDHTPMEEAATCFVEDTEEVAVAECTSPPEIINRQRLKVQIVTRASPKKRSIS